MLTNQQVAGIKLDLTTGKPYKEIQESHGVSRSVLSKIANEQTYKKIPWPGTKPVKAPGGQRKSIEDIDPTNRRILELESEVAHLVDERNLERRRAKANAKEQGVFRAMEDVLSTKITPIKPLPKARKVPAKKGAIREHVVLHLSDGHHDQIVVPGECGGLENYNFPVSCCRAESLVDRTINWTQQTLGGRFEFSDLWILAYGDHTSGEIHNHVQRSYYRNQFKNCLAIGKLHALMYRDLAPHFGRVHIVYVPGNHGRRSIKKNHHGAHDNWDYLIAKLAENYCSDIDNVEFVIPDAFSCNLDINGVGFNVFHGDDVRGSLGLPYYGLQRRQRNLTALAHAQDGPRIRYFCCGHFHKPGSVGDMDGEMLVNGPWVATDAYAFNSFAGYTEPSQWLHGVQPDHGITWRLDLKLRDETRELLGPQRYKIEI